MRNAGQPCWDEYCKSFSVDACAAICRGKPEKCPEWSARALDVEGRPDVCPMRALEHDLERVGVGARNRGLILGDLQGTTLLEHTAPLQAVRAWLANKPWSLDEQGSLRGTETLLAICGTKGIGKTVAACYALSRFNRGRLGCRYILSSQVVDPESKPKRWAKVGLLVIDQLGSEYVANQDWRRSRFTELLDRRYAELAPTILVGNMTHKSFTALYGGLVDDRMSEDGAFFEFRSRSLRGGLK